jgi:hypothetical protein
MCTLLSENELQSENKLNVEDNFGEFVEIKIDECYRKKNLIFGEEFSHNIGKDILFKYPHGIAIDNVRIYVTDSENHKIHVFEKKDSKYVGSFGKWGEGLQRGITVGTPVFQGPQRGITVGTPVFQGPGLLNCPRAIAVNDNNLYVGDSENYKIQVFNKKTLEFIKLFGDYFYDGFYVCISVSDLIATDKELYVAHSYPYDVKIFDINSEKFLRQINRPESFNSASYLTNIRVVDQELFCLDSLEKNVEVYDVTSCKFKRAIDKEQVDCKKIGYIKSMTIIGNEIYVSDVIFGQILIFDKDTWKIKRTIDNINASYITVYDDNIFISDIKNKCIQVWKVTQKEVESSKCVIS